MNIGIREAIIDKMPFRFQAWYTKVSACCQDAPCVVNTWLQNFENYICDFLGHFIFVNVMQICP